MDVFYFYPTAWSRGEGDPYLADINNASMRADAPKELISQASAFEKAANIFAPWYRQLDVSWMATQLTLEERFPYFRGAPLTDGIAAFEYYLEHWNEGRPFILAGHSQGSEMVRELLITWMKDHPDVYQRMVAAYIIGYSITQDDLSNNKHLKFANSAGDVGVIISYNTEAPEIGGNGKNLTVIDGSIAINPISWTRTGDTAFASQSKGARKYNKETGEYEDKGPLADARVNLERGTVICSTVDVDEYSLKGYEHIFPRGVFHIYDYALYYHDLEENAVLRANNYTKNAINGK
ncbi:MAG: DUF3089 domain-containing protein [Prevotellaceae bacterium]|nr:DUF3089 domain-containing protein [Prevotellaceae bacterium]